MKASTKPGAFQRPQPQTPLLRRVTDSTGRSISFSYNGAGNLANSTDARGKVTRYKYDDANFGLAFASGNELTEITEPGAANPIIRNVYGDYEYIDVPNPVASLPSSTLGGSDIHVMPIFDQTIRIPVNGKVVKQYDANGNQWNYSYDTSSSRTTMTDNKGNQLIHEYDEDYRLIKSTDASGHASNLSFGWLNEPLTTADQNDATTTYGYDANGNVAGAYIGIWLILFGYLLAMGNKLSNLRRQVDALTEAVERKDKNENLV